MAMLSDLKWTLTDVIGSDVDLLMLDTPVRFKLTATTDRFNYFVCVQKKGKSWKVLDEYCNEWTLSNLDSLVQAAIYYSIQSMYDPRKKPANYNLILE